MGTTAASDARTAISVCTAHNMDSIDPLDQNYLNTYMSLGADGKDASKSKSMTLQANSTTLIDYYYRRGDVTLKGVIDLVNGNTTWSTTLTDVKRFNSLAQGLKVNGVAAGTANPASATAAIGQLGVDASLTFPT